MYELALRRREYGGLGEAVVSEMVRRGVEGGGGGRGRGEGEEEGGERAVKRSRGE